MYLLKEKLMNGSVEIDSWEILFDMSFEQSVKWIKNRFEKELSTCKIKILHETNEVFSYLIENNDCFPLYGTITTNKITIISE